MKLPSISLRLVELPLRPALEIVGLNRLIIMEMQFFAEL